MFLRLLGLCYLTAFVSLYYQIEGLYSTNGILPISRFLEAVTSNLPDNRYLSVPTIFWLDASDRWLHGAALTGALFSLLLTFGFIPFLSNLAALAIYLSFVVVGQNFLSFQWDSLLLETGFLAIFVSPLCLNSSLDDEAEPHPLGLYLLYWLLFRLMFGSGSVKLLSNDPTWANLTALDYHFETQPIPNAVAYYFHQLSPLFHKFCTATTLFIELIVPFFIFAPRVFRHLAGIALIFLQLLIILTGNYAFFNLLTIALSVLLFDDRFFAHFLPANLKLLVAPESFRQFPLLQHLLMWPAFLVLLSLSVTTFFRGTIPPALIPVAVQEAVNTLRPLRLVNNYGLFAVMTTTRPEIIVQGSNDGENWLDYEFKWKIGDLKTRPPQVAPHQPRLDWQIWFAALGRAQENVWFLRLLEELLKGTPSVVKLLKTNPFPDSPPKKIRAELYQYHFTTFDEKRQSGNWWKREYLRSYVPAVSLKQAE